MNAYQRYFNVLRNQPVDFLPRIPILMQYAAEYIGSDYAAFASDHRVLVHANAQCAKDFGFDQLSCISDPYRETHGFGGAVTYVTNGPPHCTVPLQDSKDLSILPTPHPMSSERMADRVHAAEAYKLQFQNEYSILGWIEGPAAEAADLRGVSTFMIDLIDDPPFAADLMDRCVAVGVAFAHVQIHAGADTIGIGDAIASQVDPQTYEQLIQPRQKQLVAAVHHAGARVKLHICGNTTHLLPGIADLGVDILDVDHMVELPAVRDAVGPRVVISGNMDPVTIIQSGTPDTIRRAVAEAYQAVGNPYMVNAGCEIPSGTPPQNLSALCEPLPYVA